MMLQLELHILEGLHRLHVLLLLEMFWNGERMFHKHLNTVSKTLEHGERMFHRQLNTNIGLLMFGPASFVGENSSSERERMAAQVFQRVKDCQLRAQRKLD